MPLESIELPDSAKSILHTAEAAELIDDANDWIAEFMLANQDVTENFVTCDFHLFDRSLRWVLEQRLSTGGRFLEIGSGMGVVTMLAALQGMEACGIEIDRQLVNASSLLADELEVEAEFYCGSFVPRNVEDLYELALEIEHVDTDEDDVYAEIGLELDDFDVLFAFPWPGEEYFFESVFEQCAADGALLMMYGGREGMNLARKVTES